MGCDIHVYSEMRNEDNEWELIEDVINENNYDPDEVEWWGAYTTLDDGRDYDFFNLIAGVRGYRGNGQLFATKGLPYDISDSLKIISDQWDADGHTPSWLSREEIIEKIENNEVYDERLKEKLEQWVGELPPEGRVVFWFDN